MGDKGHADVPLQRLQQQMHDYASELQLMQQQLGVGGAEFNDALECIVAALDVQPKPKPPGASVTQQQASPQVVAYQMPPAAAGMMTAQHLAGEGVFGEDEEQLAPLAPPGLRMHTTTDVVGTQEVVAHF
jgi:hypothetical protein